MILVGIITIITPVNLLLQNNTVHAGLEQREHQACLALEFAQTVQDLCRRLAGHGIEDGSEL